MPNYVRVQPLDPTLGVKSISPKMLRLQFVLFQADESGRLLVANTLPSLRTALLLLDNAVELLLDCRIGNEIQDDQMQRAIQTRAIKAGIPSDHPDFSGLLSREFLSKSEVAKVARLFDEKLKFVSEDRRIIDADVASVLSHIHRYRNESYHGGRVRSGILRTTVAIQLHIVCDLVKTLRPGSAGYSSGDDFSWLRSRFDLDPSQLWTDTTLSRVLSEIRNAAKLTDQSISTALAENLEERIADLDEAIDFILTETDQFKTPVAAMKAAQSYTLDALKRETPYPPPPRSIEQPIDGSEIDRIRGVPTTILSSTDRMTALSSFAAADTSLDRLEYVLRELGGAIDARIQHEIDLARGK